MTTRIIFWCGHLFEYIVGKQYLVQSFHVPQEEVNDTPRKLQVHDSEEWVTDTGHMLIF